MTKIDDSNVERKTHCPFLILIIVCLVYSMHSKNAKSVHGMKLKAAERWHSVEEEGLAVCHSCR